MSLRLWKFTVDFKINFFKQNVISNKGPSKMQIFVSYTVSRPTVGPLHSHLRLVQGALSVEVKQLTTLCHQVLTLRYFFMASCLTLCYGFQAETEKLPTINGVKPVSPEQEELIHRLVYFQNEYEQPSEEDLKRITVSIPEFRNLP